MQILEDETRQRLQPVVMIAGFLLAFILWAASGFDQGGAVLAAWLSLGTMTLMAVLAFSHSLFIGIEGRMHFPMIISLAAMSTVPVGALVWANYHGWAWLWTAGWLSTSASAYKVIWGELIRFSRKGDGVALAASILDRYTGTKQLLRKLEWASVLLMLAYLTLAQIATLPKPVMVTLFVLAWVTGFFGGILIGRIYRAENR